MLLLATAAPVLAAPSLSLSFTGPSTYTPGQASAAGAYELVVANGGPDAATDFALGTTFPAGGTLSWTCTAGGGGTCPATSGTSNLSISGASLPNGHSRTYAFTVTYPASRTGALTVGASTDADAHLAINRSHTATRAAVSALSVSKTSTFPTYAPGGGGGFQIVVNNAGPSNAIGVDLVDTPAANMTIGDWTCVRTGGGSCTTASGTGSLNTTITLPVGATDTYTVPVTYGAGATGASLTNSVALQLPGDTTDDNPANNSASASVPRHPALAFTLGYTPGGSGTTYIPGSTGNALRLTVTNGGSANATGVPVALDLPSNVVQTLTSTWTCSPAAACSPQSGTGDLQTAVTLAASASVNIDFVFDYDSAALADLVLDAIVDVDSRPGADASPDPSDIRLSRTSTVTRRADARIAMTAPAAASPGVDFEMTVLVANDGPSDIGNGSGETGVQLNVDFPTGLAGAPTACAARNLSPTQPCFAFCPSDNGVVGNYTVDNCPTAVALVAANGDVVNRGLKLRRGSTSTLKAWLRSSPGFVGDLDIAGSVTLASATPAIVDPANANNAASVQMRVEPTTDIAVTKVDNLGGSSAVAGDLITYTITVENRGFEAARGVDVDDVFPLATAGTTLGFVPGSISWQCSASEGACCTHNGSANTCGTGTPTTPVVADIVDAKVDLPGLSNVVITATGRIDPSASSSSATDTLDNTATITVPAGIADGDPSNNTATAETHVSNQPQLQLGKSLLSIASETAPFTLTYELLLDNTGSSRATGVTVADPLNDLQLVPANASWTCEVVQNTGGTNCSAGSGSGPLLTLVDIGGGGRIRFVVTVKTRGDAVGVIRNRASATGPGVNVDSPEVETNLAASGDLSVTKVDVTQSATAVPGEAIEYLVTVRNTGNDDAIGARIVDALPQGLENASWSCSATTPVPGDLRFLATAGSETGGVAMAATGDGRHVYIAAPARATPAQPASVAVYQRENVPGQGFGQVALLETEFQGINDPSDTGAAVNHMRTPVDVALSPDDTMLFVLSTQGEGTASIAAFNRVATASDTAHGRLSYAGGLAIPASSLPDFRAARIVASATNLYVSGTADIVDGGNTQQDVGHVLVFRRSASTGMPTYDLAVTTGVPSAPGALALSAADAALFVASSGTAGSTRLARFPILPAAGQTPAGRLGTATGTGAVTLNGITDLAIAPAQKQLYAIATGAQNLVLVRYDNGLVDMAQSEASFGLTAEQAFRGNARIALAPDGEHLLLSNAGSTPGDAGALVPFRRDITSGSLALEDGVFGAADLGGASDITVTADGRHILVSAANSGTGESQLAVYTRRAPDPVFGFLELEREGSHGASGLQAPSDVAVSPLGEHVYAVSLAEGALTVFRRDGSADALPGAHLTQIQTHVHDPANPRGLDRARRVHVSPDGRNVFVSSEDTNIVSVFDRNVGTGLLTHRQVLRDGVGGVDGLLGAHGMVSSSDSTYLYVAGSFEAAVAQFKRDGNGNFSYIGVLKNGNGGATGMLGMRDLTLVMDGDGSDRREHVLGVGTGSNAVVTLRRDMGTGVLSFVQSRPTTGVRLMAVSARSGAPDDNQHVYTVGQDDDSLIVLRRVSDPASSAYGSLSTLFEYRNIPGMDGPSDVVVSPDGRRVYVSAQYGNAVLVFDRDLNRNSANYGSLVLVETRRDGVDGVDGLRSPYALATSSDSRHVYVAGFDDRAIAAFAVGSGSYCSAAGGGDIDDRVNLGAGGTLEYRVRAFIRADATGTISNTACVTPPLRFDDTDPSNDCSTFTSTLTPKGDVAVTKSNGRVSSGAGETVRYVVRVDNPGPSNLVHDPANGRSLTVTDLLDSNPGLVPGSATWTCEASGSGSLDFVDVTEDSAQVPLGGVTDLVRIADPDGNGPLPGLLAAASVLDDAVVLFERDPADGRLVRRAVAKQGESMPGLSGNVTVTSLAGARAVAASADGQFLYVASRVSDTVTVFGIENVGGVASLRLRQVLSGHIGLDQASHLVLSADANGRFLYVAGSNDDAIAVFERNSSDGSLAFVQSLRHGAVQGGMTVAGLDGVDFLVPSADGEHLYALASSAGTVALMERNSISGMLTWRSVASGASVGGLEGASAAVFDSTRRFLYVAAADGNRVVVLRRQHEPAQPNFGSLVFDSRVEQGVGTSLGLVSPRRLVLSADDAHLYVSAQAGSSIAWYGRDENDGSLRYLGQRSSDSADVLGLRGATGIALDDASGQLYVAGTLDGTIAHFERQADSSCPSSGSGDIDAVPVNIAAGGSVTFTIDAQVSSTLATSLVNVASVDTGLCEDPGDPCVDENDTNNSAEDIDAHSQLADLYITKTDGLAAYEALSGARAIVGDNRDLYSAGSDDNAIGIFRRTDDPLDADFGDVRFVRALHAGEGGAMGLNAVADLVLSPDGAHLYAASPVENSVAAFRRGADGALAYLDQMRNGSAGVAGLSGARAIAMSADGRHVYVAGQFSNAVAAFSRNVDPLSAQYGRLTYIGSVQHGVGGADGLLQPVSLAVAPDGKHVYVLSGTGNSLAVLLRNPNADAAGFGQISFLKRYQGNVGGGSGLEGGRSLVIDGSGNHVYVLGGAPGSLAHFVRTPASGDLVLDVVLVDGDAGVSGLAGAERLRLAHDGVLHVAATASDALLSFTRDGNGRPVFGARVDDGDAAPGGGEVLGLDGVRDVFATPDDASLYTVAGDAGALAAFDRAGSTSGFRDALFDGLGGVAPGSDVKYTIVVGNHGPAAVDLARVVDTFPPEFVSVSWTCAAPLGAGVCLAPNGAGNLDTQVRLPVGSEVIFEAVGTLANSVEGMLSNTATVQAVGVIDPDTTNNSATDNDTVLSPALDLHVEFVDVLGDALPGDRIDYLLDVGNRGPTYAAGATLRDVLPDAVLDATWTCSATPVTGVLATPATLPLPGAGTVTAIATSTLGRHVYATAQIGGVGHVLAYARDPLDGRLVLLEALANGIAGVGGIDGAADLALSGDERFVYVAGTHSDAIAVFERDADGTLTYLRRYEDGLLGIEGLGGVVRLLASPGGTHLYAAGNIDSAIAVFSINAATGALTQVGLLQNGGGIDGLSGVTDLAWSQDATHLLVVARANRSLAAFARNSANGLLTAAALRQEFEADDGALLDPTGVSTHGNRVWVVSGSNGRISEYAFDATAATFSDASTVLDGIADPADVLFDPDQARFHVAANGEIVLYSLLRGSAEELARYAAPQVQALAFAPGLKQLYAGGSAMATYARERGSRCPLEGSGGFGQQTVDIAPNGKLELHIGGSLYPNAVGLLRYEVAVQARDTGAELAPADNTAVDERPLLPEPTLSIAKTDGLANVIAGTPLQYRIDVANGGVSAAIGARLLDAAPTYPAATAGLVADTSAWSCAVAPPLSPEQALDASAHPALQGVGRLALSPDGRRVYAANAARDALLVIERALDGSLGAVQEIVNGSALGTTTVSGLDGPSAVAVRADGREVYVTGADANSLVVFAFDPDAGTHAWQQTLVSGSNGVLGMQGPRDVVVRGDTVYVAAATSDSIVMFRRSAATGQFAFVERVRDGFGTITPDTEVIRGVRRLVLSADGSSLYSLATLSQSVASFAITPDTGTLRYLGVLRAGTVPALLGARDLLSTPGDRHLYALGNAAIVRLDRQADTRLAVGATTTGATALNQPRALAVDASGARLYLADAVGGVEVFARDWGSGAIAWRHRMAPGTALAATDAALLIAGSDVLASTAAPGAVQRFAERPLSYCHAANGTGNLVDTTLDLAVGGTAQFVHDAIVHPSARGVLHNVARIEPRSDSSPDALAAEASDDTTILVESALSVSKTGPATAVAGTPIRYEIRVGNAGPSDAIGARVVDTLDAVLENASWTCSAGGTSSCPASGNGSIDAAVTLHVGDELVFTVDAIIDSAFVGDLANTVALVPEAGATDPDTSDNSASVTTTVTAEVDLSIAKSNGVDRIVAGTQTVYTLAIANAGPSDAPQSRVRDLLPIGLHGATWTCAGSAGANCTAPQGNGSIDTLVSLPAGSSATILLTATLDDEARGEIENTASVAVQGDPLELDPNNNVSSDRDAIDVVTDIRLALRDGYDPYDPASPVALPYEIEVHNAGPSSAGETLLQVTLPGPIATDVPEGCELVGTQLGCVIPAMFGGERRNFTLALRDLPAAPGTYAVSGEAHAPEPDPDPANNLATQDTTLRTGVDVVVTLQRLRHVSVGDMTRYRIDITNVGSLGAEDVAISIPVADGLLDATWTCSGNVGCAAASGAGDIEQIVDIVPGRSLRFELHGTVDPAIPANVTTYIEQFAQALVPDDADINTANNSALDIALVHHGIFADSFEEPVIKRLLQDIATKAATMEDAE